MKEFFRGFLLITALSGFVLALWPAGQNLHARRSQAALRAQWIAQNPNTREFKHAAPVRAAIKKAKPHNTHSPVAKDFPSARLIIPDAGLDTILVGSITAADLRRGPGWMPGTARPGERGNCVIAGHRNIYGSPFLDLDKLSPGSEIQIQTPDTTFTYTVVALSTVSDNDRAVVAAPADNSSRLTLITCTVPATSYRLIVSAIQS
jgi:sortase A